MSALLTDESWECRANSLCSRMEGEFATNRSRMSRMGIQRRVPTSAGSGEAMLLGGAHPVLPVGPRKPDNSNDQDSENNRIELVKVFAKLTPVLTQLHTEVG